VRESWKEGHERERERENERWEEGRGERGRNETVRMRDVTLNKRWGVKRRKGWREKRNGKNRLSKGGVEIKKLNY